MKLRSFEDITVPLKTDSDLPNYGQALRLLKNTETLLERRKKQLRVQAIRAQKGSWIEQEQEHKAFLRDQARAQNQKALKQYKALKEKQLLKIERLRQQSERKKQQNLKNRSQSRLEVIENKIKMHKQIRQKSQEHERKVRQFKMETIQQKKVRCLSLYKDLQSSRAIVNQFQQNHISEARSLKSRERDNLLLKIRQKQKELQSLNQEESTQFPNKETSTTDIKTKDQLPYSRKSSYLKNRKKSISDAKFEASSNASVNG